ncbi:MAG TPA: M20/M25/M40 family metallo-hydrolase, partial [Clostridiales bacterium]|nr:M20/M25/M40 family metallo-hydrolase [Clostridiales bacterium]
ITTADRVSGREETAAAVVSEILSPLVEEVHTDCRGSVIGSLHGSGPLVLLDAHLDQIGFVLTAITEDGFLKFDKCGGPDERTLAGMEVTVLGKGPVYGVITTIPPHLAKAEEEGKAKPETELAIDTGLTKQEAEALLSLGDRIVPKSHFSSLLGTEVSSAALDDRAGIATFLRVLEMIRDRTEEGATKPNLSVQFSVQEECGGKAAGTAAFAAKPDMALAVDVSFAYTPGCKKEECGRIGKGPMIGTAPVLDYNMTQALKAVAEAHEIPYQMEVMTSRTGTHADDIAVTRSGVPTALVSIPLKYMHTPVEVIDTKDLEWTAKLIAEFLLALAEKAEGDKTNG